LAVFSQQRSPAPAWRASLGKNLLLLPAYFISRQTMPAKGFLRAVRKQPIHPLGLRYALLETVQASREKSKLAKPLFSAKMCEK